jgi:methylenetetrahydrofolate dehydrogenase (NADP+) / methenyltetrahydrofolate cyclohydrolase
VPILDTTNLKKSFESFLRSELVGMTNAGSLEMQVILIGEDKASLKYVSMKQTLAHKLGIKVTVNHLPSDTDPDFLRRLIQELGKNGTPLLVQLPVPKQLEQVISDLPPFIDIDLLGAASGILWQHGFLPPTIGAIDIILKKNLKPENTDIKDMLAHKIDLRSLKISVIGQGKLVGKPLLKYLSDRSATIFSFNLDSDDYSDFLKQSQIIISGVGKANFFNPDWLMSFDPETHFPLVIDAGTSETDQKNGVLAGDVPLELENRCTLVGVPGGLGPLTVRYIFWNLLKLYSINFTTRQ